MKKNKLVVIGGGAAGFFCAVNAARLDSNLEVILIEKSNKLLSKVKISGGGRCNVTHACFSISELIKYYPRGSAFLKKSFHHFNPTDTVRWFEERGVLLKTESDGRMFPVTDSSQTIIDCLLHEASKYHVKIMMNVHATTIQPVASGSNDQYQLTLSNGKTISADFVCIACGGFPKIEQFTWIQSLHHKIDQPVPSLFTFNLTKHPITSLMGITVKEVAIKINQTKFQQNGPLLITHWGFSGPAVLKLSAWAARELHQQNYDFNISINWLPEYNENTLRDKMQELRFTNATQKVINRNPFGLPARLWEFFIQQVGISEEIRWTDLPAKNQNKLIKQITGDIYPINGKTTFKEEFVTSGGVDLSEVDYNTMESKLHKSLFFAGEILNIDGVTGGFNFQNAWTTGFLSAEAISKRSLEIK